MSKYEKLGLPYMGSKRRLAKEIVEFIKQENPEAEYFYDIFGGGGSVSFTAIQSGHFKEVHYNELNTAVVELLKKIQRDGVTKEFYKWYSREEYKELKNGNDWVAGLLQVCWSFGNNQKDYLYANRIEQAKKELHDEIMAMEGDIQANRIMVCRNRKKESETKMSENLARIQQLEKIQHVTNMQQLENIQMLERVQHIARIKQIKELEKHCNFIMTNDNALTLPILTDPNKTVIYLDPPYKNTSKYKEDVLINEVVEYIKNSPCKCYMSSYNCDDLICVKEMEHSSTYSATNNSKKVIEKLFTKG